MATTYPPPMTLRAYLLALKAGHKPTTRPDIPSEWTSIVESIERSYDRSGGKLDVMERAFTDLGKAFPQLENLLNPLSTLARVEEEDMPALPVSARLDARLSNGACPEMDWYIEFSKKASPEAWPEFHQFCAMWLFSAIANRRVYTIFQRKKVYGNLYVILSGRSTLVAKTTTSDVVKDVLIEMGLEHLLVDDRISPQKLLSTMSGSYVPTNYCTMAEPDQEVERQKLAMPSQKAYYYDEIGKFIQGMQRKGSSMADYVELFLKLDSCPARYAGNTFARGLEPVKKPFLTVIGTMVPANFQHENAMKPGGEFWRDGFWSRFSFVCAPLDFFVTDTLKRGLLRIPTNLTDSLLAWHKRLGIPECNVIPEKNKDGEPNGKYTVEREDLPETELEVSDDAYKAYEQYRIALRSLIAKSSNHDFDASYGRLPETALRMALIMASLQGSKTIDIRHWAKAQELAEVLRKNLHVLYAQASTVEHEPTLEDEIKAYLISLEGRQVTASEIRQRGPRKLRLPAAVLNKTLEEMEKAGDIQKTRAGEGKLVSRYYVPKDEEKESRVNDEW